MSQPIREDLPTGTITFLLTDIEGSTELWEQYPEVMRTALIRHDAIFDAAVDGHSGVHVRPRGEGDSRFAVFQDAVDAVAAAVARAALPRNALLEFGFFKVSDIYVL